jgi:phage portal protein BeeE
VTVVMSSPILGPDGRPLTRQAPQDDAATKGSGDSILGLDVFYARATNEKYLARNIVSDPARYHPWVFAAVQMATLVAGQAPYMIFRDTDLEKAPNRFGRAGVRRRALARHAHTPLGRRFATHRLTKSLEPQPDHELMALLQRPNPYLVGNQLMLVTLMTMFIYNQAFWLLTDDDGEPPRGYPTRIWPVPPGILEPTFSHGTRGEINGWKYDPEDWMPHAGGGTRRVDMEDVIQFKIPDPSCLYDAMSPLAAIAGEIQADANARQRENRLLRAGGVPKAVVQSEQVPPPEKRDELRATWREQYDGDDAELKTAFLWGGLKYQSIAWTPREMATIEQSEQNRLTELAVLMTPQSVLGWTEFTNYATAQIHNFNYWDKKLSPMLALVEMAIDASVLMATTTDVIFGMFDVRYVEALRAGLVEKIDGASRAASEALHMPPAMALELFGVDTERYDGDDASLVNALLMPASEAARNDLEATKPEPPAPPPLPVDPDDDADPVEESRRARSIKGQGSGPVCRQTAADHRRHAAFLRAELRAERSLRREYRAWLRDEREIVLGNMRDRSLKRWDLTLFLPDLKQMRSRLRARTRKSRNGAAQASLDVLRNELPDGTPIFDLDADAVQRAIAMRERVMVRTIPQTVVTDLAGTLRDGFEAGESLAELRARVSASFDGQASSARVLRVARTETASIMNSVREEEFVEAGFPNRRWSASGDEIVRETHQIYGAAGIQPVGFDYMTLTGGFGPLRFPGDPGAPAGETINCRCILVPET